MAGEVPRDVHSLCEVLDRIAAAGEGERVSVEALLEALGPRSFGPLLLAPSLIIVSPLSGIPGLSTLGGIVIALIAGQMLLLRHRVWLPEFLLRRSIERHRLNRALGWLRPVVRAADRVVKPRLVFLTHRPFSLVIAMICVLLSLAMPLLELIPFSSSTMAAAIACFGVSLSVHDGLVALGAFAVLGGGGALILLALSGS